MHEHKSGFDLRNADANDFLTTEVVNLLYSVKTIIQLITLYQTFI